MPVHTETLLFEVDACRLTGILHRPEVPGALAVLVVVGGPQYRVGSHRQFLLLARELAAAGMATLRFDYRGMGDSEGEMRSFLDIGADIGAAIDALQARVPAVREVALWGLCDGASAALLYAGSDPRVSRLVLLNPWVRSGQTLAQSYLSEYYGARLLQPAFWKKLLGGQVRIRDSLASFIGNLREARSPHPSSAGAPEPLPERLRSALAAFRGRTLILLSGQDLTAGEFRELARSPDWARLLAGPAITRIQIDAADHTFSRRTWRDAVASHCRDWLISP
ncbi:MAG: hydrolase 1, exosortase A system-associated [Gammaproteobacteria bacterium]|nr:hydrolase 1, exosortase A system-associated [Gammaproteobacteria bacterium]